MMDIFPQTLNSSYGYVKIFLVVFFPSLAYIVILQTTFVLCSLKCPTNFLKARQFSKAHNNKYHWDNNSV